MLLMPGDSVSRADRWISIKRRTVNDERELDALQDTPLEGYQSHPTSGGFFTFVSSGHYDTKLASHCSRLETSDTYSNEGAATTSA